MLDYSYNYAKVDCSVNLKNGIVRLYFFGERKTGMFERKGKPMLSTGEEKKLEREIGPAVTVVAKNSAFKGELVCKDSIRISGQVDGDILTERMVWIDTDGRIKGNITARRVINEGEIIGDIRKAEKVDVRSNGRLIGNINAARISVAQGCFFEGEAHILRIEAGDQ